MLKQTKNIEIEFKVRNFIIIKEDTCHVKEFDDSFRKILMMYLSIGYITWEVDVLCSKDNKMYTPYSK